MNLERLINLICLRAPGWRCEVSDSNPLYLIPDLGTLHPHVTSVPVVEPVGSGRNFMDVHLLVASEVSNRQTCLASGSVLHDLGSE